MTYAIPFEIVVEGLAFDHPRHFALQKGITDGKSSRRYEYSIKLNEQKYKQKKPRGIFRARVPFSTASGFVTTKHLSQHRSK